MLLAWPRWRAKAVPMLLPVDRARGPESAGDLRAQRLQDGYPAYAFEKVPEPLADIKDPLFKMRPPMLRLLLARKNSEIRRRGYRVSTRSAG